MRNLILGFGVLLLMFASVAVLARTADRAARLMRQQMEFVAAVSHELRTPVSVIGSAAENLADGLVADPSRVKQYGSRIQTEARRLGDTVERVLLYAGIESGRGIGHRTPIAVSTLVGDALAASSDAIEEAKATVETDIAPDLPPILADAMGLRSSLQNLIANALKYGGTGRWVRVAASKVNGAAAPPCASPSVTGASESRHPICRISSSRSIAAPKRNPVRSAATGSASASSRASSRRMAGASAVESAPGKGSTFVMTLPAHLTEASPAGAVVTQRGRLGAGRVGGVSNRLLLVEDEPGLVMTLTDRLIAEGYDVETATDGETGLARGSAESFGLIILDGMLPGRDGFDVCRTIRQRGVQTPILMLTARGQVVDRVVGLKLGADDYLTKPFEMAELLARLERCCAGRRTRPRRPATPTSSAT
jgi:CheY-like chemotaxis protein